MHRSAFLLAVGLLTALPLSNRFWAKFNAINASDNPDSKALFSRCQSLSVIYYPVVGLVLAALLAVLACVLPNNYSVLVKSALVLIAWVGVTGAIHLDGLADAVDGAFAAHKRGSSDQVLAVLKDPNSGAMAIMAVALLLLLKFVLIVQFLDAEHLLSFCIAITFSLVISRLAAALYMIFTPYARVRGIASGMSLQGATLPVVCFAALTFILLAGIVDLRAAVCVCVAVFLFLFWWRSFWLKKILGYTGDCIGASIEITEVLVLLLLASII